MTAPARTSARLWSLNRQAAKAVAINAKDVDDARLLLDMLGLVDGPEGNEVLPDDKRALDIELLRACPGEPAKDDVLAERPAKTNTVPAGLTAAAEPTPPPVPPVAAPAALPPLLEPDMPDAVVQIPDTTPLDEWPEPAPEGGRAPARKPINHGTISGYETHRQRKVPIPDDDSCGCRAARSAYQRARKAAGKTQTPTEKAAPPAPSAAPGTAPAPSGAGHGIAGPDAQPQVSPSRSHRGKDGGPGASDAPAGSPVTETALTEVLVAPAAVTPVDLDVWSTAAEQSPSQSVRRAARSASTALLQLLAAMDALTRAERLQARQTAGGDR